MNPHSRAFAAIPGGAIIGVIEVQIVKILDQYGLEIAIPSPNGSQRTFYAMISRGRSRFVDEVHIPNPELRSNAELQKEENLAWLTRRLASRRPERPMLQVKPASRRLVRTSPSPVGCTFCPFWPFLENSKVKNLLLNVFVLFLSVFLFLTPFGDQFKSKRLNFECFCAVFFIKFFLCFNPFLVFSFKFLVFSFEFLVNQKLKTKN